MALIETELSISKNDHRQVEAARLVYLPQNNSSRSSKTSTLQSLRVGVVGCGYWGSKHIRVLNKLGVREIAAVDINPRTLDQATSSYPSLRPFSDLESAFPHIDAVIVATPPRSHAELAMRCLNAGKHVLIEKPMAMSQAEAQFLINAARRAYAILMVGHTFEYNAAVRELGRRIRLGELGQVSHIHSARLNLGRYQSDVNVVWDLVAHDISIMNYLLDSTPTAVSAWSSINSSLGIEDIAYIKLEYRELGVIGIVHASWLDPKKVREVTVVGSKKMAVFNDANEYRLRIFDRGSADAAKELLTDGTCAIALPEIQFEEPLLVELKHFLDCISEKVEPLSNGQSGLAVIAVLEAIDAALVTNGTATVRYRGTVGGTRAEEQFA
jgi:predicted dehydrogenase